MFFYPTAVHHLLSHHQYHHRHTIIAITRNFIESKKKKKMLALFGDQRFWYFQMAIKKCATKKKKKNQSHTNTRWWTHKCFLTLWRFQPTNVSINFFLKKPIHQKNVGGWMDGWLVDFWKFIVLRLSFVVCFGFQVHQKKEVPLLTLKRLLSLAS